MSIKRGDKDIARTPALGGKTNGLLRLVQMNYNTPVFYILKDSDLSEKETSSDLLNQLLDEWAIKYAIDQSKQWAVRSSAAQEDGQEKSYAGQYLTELSVPYKDLKQAIQNVLASFQKQDDYKAQTKDFSIIIQEMIPADYAVVLFTLDPTNLLSNNPMLQVIPGVGDKLVSGELEGLTCTFHENELFCSALNDSYGPENRKETSHEIKAKIDDLLREAVCAAVSIEKKLGYPLDIEFAIYQKQIYWLQVRPMTKRPYLLDYIIWDKTAAETSYPDITLPLSASYTTHTFEFAYHSVDKTIGYAKRILEQNKPFIEQMSGEINGRIYYNVTAWQSLIYQMPFGKKLSADLPKTWGMKALPFPKPRLRHNLFERSLIGLRTYLMLRKLPKHDAEYQKATAAILNQPSFESLSELSHTELIKAYKIIEERLKGQWFAPMATGFYAMIYFNRLKNKLAGSEILVKHPNFINDILTQDGSVISVEIVRSFQNLLEEIHQNNKLCQLFNSASDKEIVSALKVAYPKIDEKIRVYIKSFGCRASTSELKMETINYRQDPLSFIAILKMNLKNYVAKKESVAPMQYAAIIQEAYPTNFFRRRKLHKLIQKTIEKTKARENYRFMRTETFDVVRTVFLAMGNRLFTNKKIDAPRDVLYLRFEQLMNPDLVEGYRKIITAEKLRYSKFSPSDDLIRLVEIKNELYPIHEKAHINIEGILTGIGCCSGTTEGQVKIIRTSADLDQDFNGCIVVAKYFEPGWINVFSQANGIVSERGNLLSHTSIISRELGVPSIVGVKDLISSVENLNSIAIDGAKGFVYLH